MKILILGDCSSAGTNVLTQRITGEKGAVVEYSLTWGGKYWKDLISWYLRETKSKRATVLNKDQLPIHAENYLREQEMSNSYWRYIPVDVDNRSKNGATAGGYYKRLLKYEKEKGRPDVIFITDHSMNHKWQVINYNRQKYFLEKNYDDRKPNFQINPRLRSPAEVQRLAFEKAKDTYKKGSVEKRNRKIMSWFINFLQKNNYRFHKLKLYKGFDEFDHDPTVLDCSDLVDKFRTDVGRDRVDIKVQVQPEIADRIKQRYPWLTSDGINI